MQRLTDRQSDEQALRIVDMRASGVSATDIAASIGRTPQFVSTATNRILRDDLKHSGEDPQEVARHYWKVKRI